MFTVSRQNQPLACIVIPAKNEEKNIGNALRALADQVELSGKPIRQSSFEVLVLVNNSADKTAQAARQFVRERPRFPLEIAERAFPEAEAHIGNIRRILTEEACRRLEAGVGESGVILSTDADTEVAPNWIVQNLREIAGGADAVGGLIQLDRRELHALPDKIRRMHKLDGQYRSLVAWLEDFHDPLSHDRWPRHYHHFGASLAVTVKAYRATGGLPPEPALEDVAFYEELRRKDWRFRHSPAVKIHTSARLDGRIAIGLSAQLNEWAAGENLGPETAVDSVRLLTLLFQARRAFREIWNGQRLLEDAGILTEADTSSVDEVKEALGRPYFGEAWEVLDLEPRLRTLIGPAQSKTPIGTAATELETLFVRTVTANTDRFSPAGQSGTSPLSTISG